MKEKEFSFTGSDNVATTFGGVDAQFKPSKEDTSKTAMYLDDDKFNQNVLKGTKARNVKYVLDPAQFRGWLLENYYNSGFPPAFWRHRGEDEFIVIGE